MKKLVIIGARGFGREVFHLATKCHGYLDDYVIKGFIDSNSEALQGLPGYPPILNSVEAYTPDVDDVFICALGEPKFKKYYIDIIKDKKGVFFSLIHTSANVCSHARIGEGAIIQAYAFVSAEVIISDYVTIQPYAGIGHDAKIGAYCQLNSYAFMGGFAEIAEGVTLHAGAKILPYKKVGAWATVGAGSVVLRNVKPGETVFGMPAMSIEF